jgi:Microtubule associated protein (MAP65/ASE1 family)
VLFGLLKKKLVNKLLYFEDWEKENGKTFLVGGVNFMEYITAQKEEHIQQLEQEKIQREQVL